MRAKIRLSTNLSSKAEELGLKPADASDLTDIVAKVVSDHLDFVKERGMGAMGPLMGLVMNNAVEPQMESKSVLSCEKK